MSDYKGQMPAMPTKARLDGNNKVRSLKTGEEGYQFLGLTKREMIAMHAMQSIISNAEYFKQLQDMAVLTDRNPPLEQEISRLSIEYAEALLKELEK